MADKEVTVEPQVESKANKHKIIWTLEKCVKAAKRFTTREDWAHGAPASFKAATARGWDADCCAHMSNVKAMKAGPAAKAAKAKAPKTKSAPRKSA